MGTILTIVDDLREVARQRRLHRAIRRLSALLDPSDEGDTYIAQGIARWGQIQERRSDRMIAAQARDVAAQARNQGGEP